MFIYRAMGPCWWCCGHLFTRHDGSNVPVCLWINLTFAGVSVLPWVFPESSVHLGLGSLGTHYGDLFSLFPGSSKTGCQMGGFWDVFLLSDLRCSPGGIGIGPGGTLAWGKNSPKAALLESQPGLPKWNHRLVGDIYLFGGLAIHLYSWAGAEDPVTAANVLRHRVLNTTPPLFPSSRAFSNWINVWSYVHQINGNGPLEFCQKLLLKL